MTLSSVLKVRRSEVVAVQPARPTPIEVKSLSDVDNQPILRYPESMMLFYNRGEGENDPAETIKSALAEALVYYYPWAGRLKEGQDDGKLVVDCTAEGVEFVKADANVRLDQLGEDSLQPPYNGIEELLYCDGVIGATRPLGSPLFTMQVTRFQCGGFVLAFTYEHVISDALGVALFLTAISEMARGVMPVLPVWQREELLNAGDHPHNNSCPPSAALNIFDMALASQAQDHKPALVSEEGEVTDDVTHRSFFFGQCEITAIRACVPEHLKDTCTSFELTVACLIHCRATSLQHSPQEQAVVMFPVNCRNKFLHLRVPSEYYGNACFIALFICPMEDLHDLGYALQQVMKAKESVTEDYARSFLNLVSKRRSIPIFPSNCTIYFFTDLSRLGFSTLVFGPWGRPLYIGRPHSAGVSRHSSSFMLPFTNQKGQEGRLVSLQMSKHAMEAFSLTLRTLLKSD